MGESQGKKREMRFGQARKDQEWQTKSNEKG